MAKFYTQILTHNDCYLAGKSMDTFRADVARVMEGEDDMTQEQWDAMMENWLNRRASQPASEWATAPSDQHPTGIMAEAKARGITDGSRPGSFATREEVIAMVTAVK